MTTSTPEQKASYWENGILILEEFYSHEKCDEIQRHLRRHANEDFAGIMNSDRLDFLTESDPREDSPERDKEIKETVAFMRALMREPRAVSFLEGLYDDREIVGLQTMTLFKEAGSPYATQAWNPHQDNAYPQNVNGMYFTTNLFLEAADVENGTLYAFPGSHKQGLFPAEDVKSFREEKGSNPGKTTHMPEEFQDRKTDLIFKKGDILVLHGNCVHGSYANNSDRSRPITMNIYIPKGEPFFAGKTAKRMEIPLH